MQAINLAVSQANECNYCLAAHTALGKMAGFSEEETLDLRTVIAILGSNFKIDNFNLNERFVLPGKFVNFQHSVFQALTF